jgi:hypothetical protein
LETDDAHRPGTQTALPLEPVGDRVRGLGLEAFELDRPGQAYERRAAPSVQAEPAKVGRREAGEVRGGRGDTQAVAALRRGANDPALHRPRLAREDQLPAERAEEGVRDGRDAKRP